MSIELDRRAQILREALRLFAEHGVEGASLRELARRVGISQPSLYHYFSSKEALVEAIFAWKSEESSARQREAEGEFKTPQRFCLWLAHILIAGWDNPEELALMRLVHGEAIRGGHVARAFVREHIAPMTHKVARVFERFIQEGKMRAVDPEFAARSFVGPIILLMQQQRMLDTRNELPTDMQEFIQAHVDTFLHGVAR
jgi:AcrR family transcriptional regulator